MSNNKVAKTINLNGKTIAELKKMAQALNIMGRPTWSDEDYRRAIVNRQKNKIVASVVSDMASPIPEGFCRIEIGKSSNDPTGGAPVQCLVNDFCTIIPRGVIVDVPIEIVDGSLANSTDYLTERKTNPHTGFDEEVRVQIQAFPFREYGRTPGQSVIKSLIKEDKMSIRNQYRALYGRWPSRLQEAEFAKDLRSKLGDIRLEAFIEAQRQAELERAKKEVESAMTFMENTVKKPGRPKKVEVPESEDNPE